MTMAPLTLYRGLLRNAKAIKDYNFRSYAVRRVKTDFKQNKQLAGYVSELFVALVFFCYSYSIKFLG